MKRFLSIVMVVSMLAFGSTAMADTNVIISDGGNDKSHFLNPERGGSLSQLTYITPAEEDGEYNAYMKLFSGISVADYVKMNDDFIKLRDYTDIRDVTLILNSPGGSAFDGLSIADLIERMQNDNGFTVTVEATGIVASAAVPIFAVCQNREASPGTLFMVHEAALWKWPGRETSSDIIAQGKLMEKLQKRYLDYLVRNSTTPMEKWQAMEKATTWFTVNEAKELGLLERPQEKRLSPSEVDDIIKEFN